MVLVFSSAYAFPPYDISLYTLAARLYYFRFTAKIHELCYTHASPVTYAWIAPSDGHKECKLMSYESIAVRQPDVFTQSSLRVRTPLNSLLNLCRTNSEHGMKASTSLQLKIRFILANPNNHNYHVM